LRRRLAIDPYLGHDQGDFLEPSVTGCTAEPSSEIDFGWLCEDQCWDIPFWTSWERYQ
jgi:hypothetical protein